MILTCPDCATSYFVDAAKIPPEGRTVKCSACGTRWTASAEGAELELTGEGAGKPAGEADPSDIVFEAAPLSELPGEALPKVFRNKRETSRRMREAVTMGVAWAGLVGVLVAILGAAAIFRVDVVRLWPRTAAAYAAVGMPVNQIGLAIEDLTVEATLQDGHAAYSVTGAIRNVESRLITAPPLKMMLLGKDGKPLLTKIARPSDPRIPPGKARHFGLVITDPPSTAAELQVSFATEGAPAAPAAAKGGRAEQAAKDRALSLRRGLEPAPAPAAPVLQPVEAARPLPAGDPAAQPRHD